MEAIICDRCRLLIPCSEAPRNVRLTNKEGELIIYDYCGSCLKELQDNTTKPIDERPENARQEEILPYDARKLIAGYFGKHHHEKDCNAFADNLAVFLYECGWILHKVE